MVKQYVIINVEILILTLLPFHIMTRKERKNKKTALEMEMEKQTAKILFWGKSRYSFMIIVKIIVVEMVDNPTVKETETRRPYQGVWDKHSYFYKISNS